MNSARPIPSLDLRSILAVAVLVLLLPGPAAAQNQDTQREEVRKEDVRERGHLPEGFPAQQARPGGRVGGGDAPLGNLGAEGAAGKGAWVSRTETNSVGSNLVMRAGAGLTGVFSSSTSIADVDGDSNPDLLITGNAGTFSNSDPTATLYLGAGEGGLPKGAPASRGSLAVPRRSRT
jgi:hypothetical protein